MFRFGNDGCLKTVESVLIPVTFKHRSVVIRAAVLPGRGANTPLLLSKELLKQLGTQMDLSSAVVCFRKLGVEMEMGTTQRSIFLRTIHLLLGLVYSFFIHSFIPFH